MIKSLPNLYSYIGSSEETLVEITRDISSLYAKRTQSKRKFGEEQINKYGDIQYRDLLVPHFKLKILQQRINYLLQRISLPKAMFGSVKRKNNILNAAQHLNHKYFLTIDLKNFFPNINNHQVFKMFHANDFSHATARVLTQLTTLKGSLPQGTPSSPVIANLVVVDLINEISAYVAPFNITFTSYLDDFSFSSNTCFKNLVPQILNIIKKHGFFPAHKKIHYCIGGCEITGIIVSGSKLKVTPVMKRKAYSNVRLAAYVKRVEQFTSEIN